MQRTLPENGFHSPALSPLSCFLTVSLKCFVSLLYCLSAILSPFSSTFFILPCAFSVFLNAVQLIDNLCFVAARSLSCFASRINCLCTVNPNPAGFSSAVKSVSAFSVTGTPGFERGSVLVLPQLIGFVDLLCPPALAGNTLQTFCLKSLMCWFSDRNWFSYNRVQMIFLFRRNLSSSASQKVSPIRLITHLSWQVRGGTCAFLVADHILDK